jgi:hypothetical protein
MGSADEDPLPNYLTSPSIYEVSPRELLIRDRKEWLVGGHIQRLLASDPSATKNLIK